MINKYLLLEKEIEEINKINNIISLVSWDIAVNMPIGSMESRSGEVSLLGSIVRSRLKSNKISELINAAEGEVKYLDSWQLANLKEIKKLVKVTNCIDDGLYERCVATAIKSELIWRKARAENDFNLLAPYLEDNLICIREVASAKADIIVCSKYEALIAS